MTCAHWSRSSVALGLKGSCVLCGAGAPEHFTYILSRPYTSHASSDFPKRGYRLIPFTLCYVLSKRSHTQALCTRDASRVCVRVCACMCAAVGLAAGNPGSLLVCAMNPVAVVSGETLFRTTRFTALYILFSIHLFGHGQ